LAIKAMRQCLHSLGAHIDATGSHQPFLATATPVGEAAAAPSCRLSPLWIHPHLQGSFVLSVERMRGDSSNQSSGYARFLTKEWNPLMLVQPQINSHRRWSLDASCSSLLCSTIVMISASGLCPSFTDTSSSPARAPVCVSRLCPSVNRRFVVVLGAYSFQPKKPSLGLRYDPRLPVCVISLPRTHVIPAGRVHYRCVRGRQSPSGGGAAR
jgi:hypothetical protein